MASPYASAAKIASAEANLGGPIALDSSLLLKQLVVALGNVTGGGGSGTVTSVAQSFTGGLISVAGSPITTAGTLALTVAGTSGGIPYFSSASTWASSAALAANAIVVGGGAGAAPSTVTTGTGVVTALGVNVGTAGAFVVNGGALGTPSSGTLTNCTLPASGITGTLAASKGGTGVANGASCTLTLPNAATTITTGGTLALGGFTLTVPATGTSALLGTANVFTANQTVTGAAAAANTSALKIDGTAFSGGTSTSTKPMVLIETSGTTSTGWSTAGTTFGVNGSTALGTSARVVDFQYGGTSVFNVNGSGSANISGSCTAANFTAAANSWFTWAGRSVLYSPSDGVIRMLNAAENSFGRLCFGPATSGFTALKANTTTLQCRLADDSAYAAFDALSYKVGGTAGATGGTFTAITSITVTNGIITAISGT